MLTGDEIFCCLGTTIKKARTHEAFRKVDFELPLEIGLLAKQKGIQNLLVISSLGADPKSSNFYLKTKGEMEQALMELHLSGLKIFRPSMLLGPRSESRPAEAAGQILMNALSLLFIGPLRKYKAIPATTVALSMIKVANSSDSKITYESEEMADLVKLR
ncbi:MAG: hypothetical protein IPP71_17585 [Bacteroidetes bacterium]|nr:hypothetical protein [Bacteroidota bacterium]